jgi:hypothetical protein
MLDYIEQTSLKFHIERFIIDNIDEQYRFQNYIIELSKSDKYIHFHITDLSAPKEHNRLNYVALIHFYDFELFLYIFKKAKEQFQKHH